MTCEQLVDVASALELARGGAMPKKAENLKFLLSADHLSEAAKPSKRELRRRKREEREAKAEGEASPAAGGLCLQLRCVCSVASYFYVLKNNLNAIATRFRLQNNQ